MASRRFRFTRRRLAALLALSLLLALVLAKDALLLSVVQRQLRTVPDVQVRVTGAHLSLLPAGVSFSGIEVVRPGEPNRPGPAGSPLTLATVDRVETTWHWWQLFRGAVAASAKVDGIDVSIWRVPRVGKPGALAKPAPGGGEVVPGPPEPETLVANWPEIARFVVPVSIDEATVSNAALHLRDAAVSPALHFAVGGIRARVDNLTNRKALTGGRYATVRVEAAPAGGNVSVSVQLDPLAKLPTFALSTSAKGIQVKRLNDVLMAYAKFDVDDGTIDAEAQIACENGKFRGFVEPRIEHLKVRAHAKDERQDSFWNRAYRAVVRVVSDVVEDGDEQTIATRVPLRGEFLDPKIGIGEAVSTLLLNAWWESLTPTKGLKPGARPELRGSLGRQGSARPKKP